MKGIAHFTAGIAAASCFPVAVQAAADGNPLYFIIGGVAGLLPDTIDFKFYRFFYRHDAEVVPDPLNPDPQLIADAVAAAVRRAAESGRPFRLRLNTCRLGPDSWQSYTVSFNREKREISVTIGPAVDTGGLPDANGQHRPRRAAAPPACHVRPEYFADFTINAFEGPLLEMVPRNDGTVRIAFIPWHRSRSHSFITAAAAALVILPLWGGPAAMVAFTSCSLHILLDQLGYLGSNLFFPLTSHRTPGLKLLHSDDSFANFYTVWLSILLIFINLAYAANLQNPAFSPYTLALWCAILPPLLRKLIRHLLKYT